MNVSSDIIQLEDVLYIIDKLKDNKHIVLVGGQSLAVWVDYYAIERPEQLDYITRDLDFLGREEDIRFAERQLREMGAKAKFPSRNDHTAISSGLIKLPSVRDGKKTFLIDFLYQIHGIPNKDIQKSITIFKGFRVLKPFSCLVTRVHNLSLPTKRNTKGIEQAKLATKVVNAYWSQQIENDFNSRGVFKELALLFNLTKSRIGRDIFLRYGVDLLEAVPIDQMKLSKNSQYQSFLEKQWPRVVKHIVTQRDKDLGSPG